MPPRGTPSLSGRGMVGAVSTAGPVPHRPTDCSLPVDLTRKHVDLHAALARLAGDPLDEPAQVGTGATEGPLGDRLGTDAVDMDGLAIQAQERRTVPAPGDAGAHRHRPRRACHSAGVRAGAVMLAVDAHARRSCKAVGYDPSRYRQATWGRPGGNQRKRQSVFWHLILKLAFHWHFIGISRFVFLSQSQPGRQIIAFPASADVRTGVQVVAGIRNTPVAPRGRNPIKSDQCK